MSGPKPRTEAGNRLLWMVETTPIGPSYIRRWPRTFDARLVERICEEFIPRIEDEMRRNAFSEAVGIVQFMASQDDGRGGVERLIARLREEYDR